jgi:hypothetical protein
MNLQEKRRAEELCEFLGGVVDREAGEVLW